MKSVVLSRSISALGAVAVLAASLAPLAAQPTGTVQGQVSFQGTPPKNQPVNFGPEKQCAALHKGKVVFTEDIIVNKNGTLKNVLVRISSDVKGSFAPPKTPAVIDQKGCVFVPHVTAVMVGQTVTFPNSDPLLHNVRVMSNKGQGFNIAQPIQGMKYDRVFKIPEVGIQLKCDVHFWMSGYLHVLPHPFFAVTGDDGSFKIAGLPPGTYTLEAWHEKLGTQTTKVAIAAGEVRTVSFAFRGP
jgi:plastocyanin